MANACCCMPLEVVPVRRCEETLTAACVVLSPMKVKFKMRGHGVAVMVHPDDPMVCLLTILFCCMMCDATFVGVRFCCCCLLTQRQYSCYRVCGVAEDTLLCFGYHVYKQRLLWMPAISAWIFTYLPHGWIC